MAESPPEVGLRAQVAGAVPFQFNFLETLYSPTTIG